MQIFGVSNYGVISWEMNDFKNNSGNNVTCKTVKKYFPVFPCKCWYSIFVDDWRNIVI